MDDWGSSHTLISPLPISLTSSCFFSQFSVWFIDIDSNIRELLMQEMDTGSQAGKTRTGTCNFSVLFSFPFNSDLFILYVWCLGEAHCMTYILEKKAYKYILHRLGGRMFNGDRHGKKFVTYGSAWRWFFFFGHKFCATVRLHFWNA